MQKHHFEHQTFNYVAIARQHQFFVAQHNYWIKRILTKGLGQNSKTKLKQIFKMSSHKIPM
jgi:hypothetical protein